MSAPEFAQLARASTGGLAPQSYSTITIVGGGCYGSYYLRQLHRAARAGAITWQRIVVVDRNADCQIARALAAGSTERADVIVADWDHYFDDALADALGQDASSRAAIVPSPLMPHLALSWLERRARARFGPDRVRRVPLSVPPQTPWQRAGHDGTHYASYATWTCPINCIEPVRCPATRGHRAWSMPDAMRYYVASLPDSDRLLGPLVFHCSHRAYGVGMIDFKDLIAADAFVTEKGAADHAEFLVATVSHCHGALGRLVVDN